MADIELFPHNEEAYQALAASLEDNNLSFIERATGTGKSYIFIKYLANHMANKRILFVTLHDSMFKQLCQKDMPALGTSKNIYAKLDSILYSSITKHDAQWYYDNYDCIIFDEAHHCGAPKWGETIGDLRDLIESSEDKKMIGATATGIRYLDDYMDVAKEYFGGNVASKLYLSEAILREILPAPYYVNLNHFTIDKLYEIKRKLKRLEGFAELDQIQEEVSTYEKQLKDKQNINTLLKKYDVKKGEKYIVFCNNIDEIETKKEEAKEWFKDIAPIEIYEAHSKQKNVINQRQIDEFSSNSNSSSIKLMFAVDMFNEGLHIDSVDGIFMTRRTSSPIVYLQQLGRALSFSTRKKQIKIFDLVGNATDIDIISNLYKELLATAKNEIEAKNGNIEHYQKIIDRFKIVDEATDVVDRLDNINKYIEENYFNKEKIKRDILILKNYIYSINADFMYLLHTHQIDKEHLKAYKELQRLVNSLSFDDFIELNKLGIILINNQTDVEFLEKVKKYNTLEEALNIEVKTFMDSYNLFYTRNGRRPNMLSLEEANMVKKYREYLATLKPKVISKYLKNSSYPLNLEELLILKDFPSNDEINAYLDLIEQKYEHGIQLDELEEHTLNVLDRITTLKDRPLITSLLNSHVVKIDLAIKTLSGYLLDYPNERFENIEFFRTMPNIHKALRDLYKFQKYVTNVQFETLLKMNIKLPSSIDMTLDQRKKILDKYNSFYEKEEIENYSNAKSIIYFITENGRRPSEDIDEEQNLVEKLKKFTYLKSNSWSKRVISALIENNISLTIDEKIIYGYDMTNGELITVYDDVISSFKNINIDNFNPFLMRKKVKLLKDRKYIDDRLSNIFNRTISLTKYILEANENVPIEKIRKYLYNNQAIVPFSLITYIYKTYGISLVSVNRNAGNSNEINILHKKYNESMEQINMYISYIKENGKRPESYTILSQKINHYLITSSAKDVRNFCNKLHDINVPLTPQEIYLTGMASEEKERNLFEYLESKIKKSKLDEVDSHIYQILKTKFIYGIEGKKFYDTMIYETNNDVKDDVVNQYKEKIRQNPYEELSFKDSILSEAAKDILMKYRLLCLGEVFIPSVIKRMKQENKPYTELLNEEELSLLNNIIATLKRENKNLDLEDELKRVNRQIVLDNNNINIELFIKEYIDFCIQNINEPDINSNDLKESILARQYDIIIDILTSEEKKSLSSAIKRGIEKENKIDFYTSFIDFIEKNERFPTILSHDNKEVELATQYQNIGSKLPSDQRKNIIRLQKKYQINTLNNLKKLKG